MKVTKEHWFFIGILALALPWTYRHAFSIPFLYSEVSGIQNNPLVRDGHAFAEHLLTWRGFLRRPLSVLSFRLDWILGGSKVSGYHWSNWIIHLLNIAVFYVLAGRWTRFPRVATLFFAFHPLASACAAQLFGRPYSLACFFMLIALVRLSRRKPGQEWKTREIGIQSALFVFMILSKQSFVFFPLILLWHELSLGGANLKFSRLITWKTGIAFLAVIGVAAVFILRYAAPLSRTAPIGITTSVLSQFGNIHHLIRFFLLPFQLSYVHDLPFYLSFPHPAVIFGILFVSFCSWAAFRFRQSMPGFLLGALLITLIPTNSFFPKNEVIREWRLYPDLIFLALLLCETAGAGLDWIKRLKIRWPRGIFRGVTLVAGAIYFVLFSVTIDRQNVAYRNERSMWESVLERYPSSADAANNIAVTYYREKEMEPALRYFQQAEELDPTVYLYADNAIYAYQALGQNEKAQEKRALSSRLLQQFGPKRISLTEIR